MVRRQIQGRRGGDRAGLAGELDLLAPAFRKAIHAASEAFETLHVPHAVMGRLAVGAWTEPLATKDIDFLVGEEAFEVAGPIVSFRRGLPLEAHGITIDSIPFHLKFEKIYQAALATAVEANEPGIRVVRPEYLAFTKLVSTRTKDRDDVRRLLDHGLDVEKVDRLVAGNEELQTRWDTIVHEWESDS